MSRITIDVRQVEQLANKLGNLTPETFAAASAAAINLVLERADRKIKDGILSTVNITAPYIDARLFIENANKSKLQGRLYAPFKHTSLGRYAPNLSVQATKTKRVKGNAKLGIAPGSRPAAISVEVIRGSRKVIKDKTAFLNTGVLDSDGKPVIFTRAADGKIKSRYGPSVYQLFRVSRDRFTDEIVDDLESVLLQEVESSMEDILE